MATNLSFTICVRTANRCTFSRLHADAVDNHFGGLGGGHYTAFCRNKVDGQWYNYDDSRVSKADPASVQVSRFTNPLCGTDACRAERRISCFTVDEPRGQSAACLASRRKKRHELLHPFHLRLRPVHHTPCRAVLLVPPHPRILFLLPTIVRYLDGRQWLGPRLTMACRLTLKM